MKYIDSKVNYLSNSAYKLENLIISWAVKLVKHIYSNDLIKVFEDTLDLDGEEKIYTRAIGRNYSTIVPFIYTVIIILREEYEDNTFLVVGRQRCC